MLVLFFEQTFLPDPALCNKYVITCTLHGIMHYITWYYTELLKSNCRIEYLRIIMECRLYRIELIHILYMYTYEHNEHVGNVEHRILKTLTFPVKNYLILYKPSSAAYSSNTRLGAGFLTFIEGKLLRKADIFSIGSNSE